MNLKSFIFLFLTASICIPVNAGGEQEANEEEITSGRVVGRVTERSVTKTTTSQNAPDRVETRVERNFQALNVPVTSDRNSAEETRSDVTCPTNQTAKVCENPTVITNDSIDETILMLPILSTNRNLILERRKIPKYQNKTNCTNCLGFTDKEFSQSQAAFQSDYRRVIINESFEELRRDRRRKMSLYRANRENILKYYQTLNTDQLRDELGIELDILATETERTENIVRAFRDNVTDSNCFDLGERLLRRAQNRNINCSQFSEFTQRTALDPTSSKNRIRTRSIPSRRQLNALQKFEQRMENIFSAGTPNASGLKAYCDARTGSQSDDIYITLVLPMLVPPEVSEVVIREADQSDVSFSARLDILRGPLESLFETFRNVNPKNIPYEYFLRPEIVCNELPELGEGLSPSFFQRLRANFVERQAQAEQVRAVIGSATENSCTNDYLDSLIEYTCFEEYEIPESQHIEGDELKQFSLEALPAIALRTCLHVHDETEEPANTVIDRASRIQRNQDIVDRAINKLSENPNFIDPQHNFFSQERVEDLRNNPRRIRALKESGVLSNEESFESATPLDSGPGFKDSRNVSKQNTSYVTQNVTTSDNPAQGNFSQLRAPKLNNGNNTIVANNLVNNRTKGVVNQNALSTNTRNVNSTLGGIKGAGTLSKTKRAPASQLISDLKKEIDEIRTTVNQEQRPRNNNNSVDNLEALSQQVSDLKSLQGASRLPSETSLVESSEQSSEIQFSVRSPVNLGGVSQGEFNLLKRDDIEVPNLIPTNWSSLIINNSSSVNFEVSQARLKIKIGESLYPVDLDDVIIENGEILSFVGQGRVIEFSSLSKASQNALRTFYHLRKDLVISSMKEKIQSEADLVETSELNNESKLRYFQLLEALNNL